MFWSISSHIQSFFNNRLYTYYQAITTISNYDCIENKKFLYLTFSYFIREIFLYKIYQVIINNDDICSINMLSKEVKYSFAFTTKEKLDRTSHSVP